MTQPEPLFDLGQANAVLGPVAVKPPELDLEYFRRLLNYGRSVRWGAANERASAPVPADAVGEYFADFLVARQNQNLLPYLKKLTARFAIRIAGLCERLWTLDLREGVLTSVQPGADRADCCFALDQQTFLEIAAARLSPRQAFFSSRIKITGNIEIGLKVASVLARFFIEYPFIHGAAAMHKEQDHVRIAG